jgi:hypothetical protein
VKFAVAFSFVAASTIVIVWFPEVAGGIVSEAFALVPTAVAFASRIVLSQYTWKVPLSVVMFAASCVCVPTDPVLGVKEITATDAPTIGKSEILIRADVRMRRKHANDAAFLSGSFIKRLSLVIQTKDSEHF